MGIKDLLVMVKDEHKETASKIVESAVVQVSDLDKEIAAKELKLNDAIKLGNESSDKLKSVLSRIKVGDDGDIDKAISALRGSKGGSADEVALREVEALKSEISKMTQASEEREATFNQKSLSMQLKSDLGASLVKHKVHADSYDDVTRAIESIASFKDGEVKYLNGDGTTMRENGADITTDGIIANMREAEKSNGRSKFFDLSLQKSGGGKCGSENEGSGDYVPGQYANQ